MKTEKPKVEVKIERLDHCVALPLYATELAAGADLYASHMGVDELKPGKRLLVPCGFKMEIPPGYEVQIRPRSGTAFKQGITVLNSPGTIDADYRGEVKVLLVNLGGEPVFITRGDRIAQMVLCPVEQAVFLTGPLSETQRGEGGLGSTGTR